MTLIFLGFLAKDEPQFEFVDSQFFECSRVLLRCLRQVPGARYLVCVCSCIRDGLLVTCYCCLLLAVSRQLSARPSVLPDRKLFYILK